MDYIDSNRNLLDSRPQMYHHGDYHMGNLIISPQNELIMSDHADIEFSVCYSNFLNVMYDTKEEVQRAYDYFIVGVVEKVFKFTPTTSGAYTIQTNKPGTTSVDTYLELRNSSFSVLDQDDDSGDGPYSSINCSLTKGTIYYIVVTSYSHHENAVNGSNMQCGLRIRKE